MGSIQNLKEVILRISAGLIIICGLMLNAGCQPNFTDANSHVVITSTPTRTGSTQEQTTPFPTIPSEAGMQDLINRAMTDLSQRLAISVNEIVLLEATSVVWPDGSLGCPQEGMQYAQVLTPGYLIRLQSGDQEYEYHASRGTTVIYCENPTPPVPGTPGDV
jgi:hypothetical protein